MPTYDLKITKPTPSSFVVYCGPYETRIHPVDSPPLLTRLPTVGGNVSAAPEPIIDATFAEYVVWTKRSEDEDTTQWNQSDRATALDFAISWLICEMDKAGIG